MTFTTAVYAGSFDPITVGHEYIILRASKLFDRLIIAVGTNPDKKYTFNTRDRMLLIEDVIDNWKIPEKENIEVIAFHDEYQAIWAKKQGADYLIRGIRDENDFRFESNMRAINDTISCGGIETIYFIPPNELKVISSSMVKGLVGPKDWKDVIKTYVSRPVIDALEEKYNEASH